LSHAVQIAVTLPTTFVGLVGIIPVYILFYFAVKHQLVVYVNQQCSSCELVVDFVEKEGIECQVHDIDRDGRNLPAELSVFPALFNGEKLIAYGEDIISYLKKVA